MNKLSRDTQAGVLSEMDQCERDRLRQLLDTFVIDASYTTIQSLKHGEKLRDQFGIDAEGLINLFSLLEGAAPRGPHHQRR